MADTLNTLTEKLRTTEDIGSIVGTMKSLSAVSIHQYETAVEALAAYQRTVDLGLQVVLRQHSARRRQESASGENALVVFGSDRGLCGRFNRIVAAAARDFIERASGPSPRLLVVGGQIDALLHSAGFSSDTLFQPPGSARAIERSAQSILLTLQDWQEEGLASIHVVAARRGRQTQVDVETRRLAPIAHEELDALARAPWDSRRLPMFRMATDDLLSWLLRERLFIALQRAGAESLAAEHAMRLAAMQAAERNIEERLDDVRQSVRQVRQDSITTELLDIVTGFEATGKTGAH